MALRFPRRDGPSLNGRIAAARRWPTKIFPVRCGNGTCPRCEVNPARAGVGCRLWLRQATHSVFGFPACRGAPEGMDSGCSFS